MYEDENENLFPFDINHEMIMQAEMMSCTHDCVRMIQKNEYLTVGEYLQHITTSQLDEMLDVAEDEDNPKMEEFLLIAEMLARAEGLSASEDFDVLQKRVNILVALISIESLYRRGMIKIYRENFSFGDDMNTKKIAEKL
jgi:hypothetical protein